MAEFPRLSRSGFGRNNNSSSCSSLITALMLIIFCLLAITIPESSTELQEYPCAFNSLCNCAVNSTGLITHHKIVVCDHVPFAKLPDIPRQNVTKLSIIGSGMEILDDSSVRSLELSSLSLVNNNLVIITNDSLVFSAKTLTALDLSYNRLQNVPQRALAGLSNLALLSLESNEISSLLVDWSYLKNTLTALFLGGNNINQLTSAIDYTLGNFQSLILLNLNKNYITSLEQNSVPFTLKTLYVSHNLLEEFPSHLVNNLEQLTKLYLKDNYLQQIPVFKFNSKKHLDVLDLSNNLITSLNEILGGSIQIKELDLSYNNIASINSYAFNGLGCSKLSLAHNRLSTINEKAFYSLKTTLEYLDLGSNRLVKVPKSLVGLRKLKSLSLSQNHLTSLPDSTFKNSSQYLQLLYLNGNNLVTFPKYALRNIKRLVKLEISYNLITQIRSSDFIHWGDQLEALYIKSNKIDSLEYNAFKNLPKLRQLGLPFNNIRSVDNKAFTNLAVPLKYLDLSFTMTSTGHYPEDSLKTLKNLEQLVLCYNNFTSMPRTALYNFAKLQKLNLDFNNLVEIPSAFFNSYVLKHLQDIRLSFNKLYAINSKDFIELESLQFIGLNDNQMTVINGEAFKNLNGKLTIIIANNMLHTIHPNAFTNIPNLYKLDIHNNELQTLDWNMLHNVTNSMQPMTLNLSRNRIENIIQPNTLRQIHVKTLDLSHNKLNTIRADSFQFFNDSLRTLIFGYNEIKVLPPKAFVLLKSLEVLNLEHNMINQLIESTFHGLDKLQMLDLSHNHISRLNAKQFANLWNLRILDLSYNDLSTIPGENFVNTKLERLILKHNRFSVIPAQSFYDISQSLQYLDLSNNMIEQLERDVFNSVRSITNLNLCSNHISQMHELVFQNLDNLIDLQLCGNKLLRNFEAIYKTKRLNFLNLADTGLKEIRNFQLEHLVRLNVSGNNISRLYQGFLIGLPQLRQLDLSRNNLTSWNIIGWNHAQYLKELDVSNNPIKILTKDSFEGLDNLKILNVQHLKHLERFDADSLSKCKLLEWLKVQTWPNIEKYRFRLPGIVPGLKHLKKLTVDIQEDKLTDQLVQGFPPKLKYLEITGSNLREVSADSLKGLDGSKEMFVRFTKTNITNFPPLFFWKFTSGKSTLDLKGNNLEIIGPEMFYKSATSIRRYGTKIYSGGIHVQDNPVLCNCDSHWLGYWMKRYLYETLRIHQKEPEYGSDIIEHMKEATCLNPINGRRIPILTYENNACDTSGASTIAINLVLIVFTMWLCLFR